MPKATPSPDTTGFSDFGLPPFLLRALTDVGYETPSPIQMEAIPALLAGRDLVGQAQTGTGKTAAFALPILSRLDFKRGGPQALVLTPTRELAIQVAEAFQRYAAHLPNFHVLPIYGGQGYGPQLTGLKRRPHVVIGTPGRVIDHIERGTLKLAELATLVLDEGDEMLRMGFVEEVEKVLAVAPANRQLVLFSATMPPQVRRIAKAHLRDPAEITIRHETATVAETRQRFLMVSGPHKLDVLTRILEVETFDAMLVFTRTKVASEDLAQRLAARGYAAAPLHGDIAQAQRERTVARLKKGEVDILVATDVAARGLDVGRISHVLNFDIPIDIESYVHRIGRTGRAGRSGEAIVFVTHRERHLLHAIERATGQKIAPMPTPTVTDVNAQRVARFKERITAALDESDLDVFRQIVEQYVDESDVPAIEIAAALAKLAHGKKPMLEAESPHDRDARREDDDRKSPAGRRSHSQSPPARPTHTDRKPPSARQPTGRPSPSREARSDRKEPVERHQRGEAPLPARKARNDRKEPVEPRQREETSYRAREARHDRREPVERRQRGEAPLPAREARDDRRSPVDRRGPGLAAPSARDRRERATSEERRPLDTPRAKRREQPGDIEMERYRVAVGSTHGVKAGNLVGAIANEAGLDSEFIGRIDIREDHSFVELPVGMPRELVRHMRKVWVSGQKLDLTRVDDAGVAARRKPSFRDEGAPKKPRPHRKGEARKRHTSGKPGRPPRRG